MSIVELEKQAPQAPALPAVAPASVAARVNLLPPELALRAAARRLARNAALAFLVFLALLGGIYFMKLGAVRAAQAERDATAAQVQGLQGQVAQLSEFGRQREDLERREAALTAAMAREVGLSQLLSDVAGALPPATSLRTLTVAVSDPALAVDGTGAPAAALAPVPGGVPAGVPIGLMQFDGYTVEQFDPGVSSVLVDLTQVPGVRTPFLASAQTEQLAESEVTSFSGTVDITDEILTNRYVPGQQEG